MSIDDSKIEGLKKKLYSNSDEQIQHPGRPRLQRHSVLVNNGWVEKEDGEQAVHIDDVTSFATYGGMKGQDKKRDRGAFFKKILGLVSILFVFALVFAGYKIFSGSNFISNSNIDIKLLGPVTAPSGDILSLDVDLINKNNTDLILADLVITYPEGTRNAEDRVTAMPVDRIPLGTIGKNQVIRTTIRSVLFGEENAKKNIKVSLEYRIEGSSRVFVKDKQFPIFIGSSPITVNVDASREIIPEQESEFRITIRSNSQSIVKGLLFKVEYPFGFDFVSAVPSTTGDTSTWVLGDINPGEEREILLRGRLLGGNNQERVFRFYTGTESPTDKTSIGTVFVTNSTPITLKKPFISADLSLDGKTSSIYVAQAGEAVKGEIVWQNNLDVPVSDVVIQARITGPMLDKSSVKGDQGFYRSVDNTVLWDNSTIENLKEAKAGDIGRVQFSFAALPPNLENNSTYRRETIKVELSIRAKRLNEDSVPEEIVSNVVRDVKIASEIGLTTRLVRSIGPFENTGPVPPMPEQPSTYTVLVSLKNSFNSVKDVVYTATLPQYVEWLGQTYPANSPVTYNADKRQITWQVGDMQPGIGYSSSAKDFAFQVSFLPSVGQNGATPQIITSQRVSGKDNFTGQIITTTVDPLDIKIETDPQFKYGDDKVGGEDN